MLLGLLLVIQIIVCIALVAVILLQRSEGGALGMGGGAGSFMTARGAGDLLTRTTSILGAVFFILSIVLTVLAGRNAGAGSVVDRLKVDALNPESLATPPPAQPGAPAAPGTPAAPAAPGAAPGVFTAPAPQVNTAPAVAPGAAPTATTDAGARDPAAGILGVQTAPQATQPQPQPAR